jgi:hypothetical protein
MAEVLEFNEMFYTNFEPKMKNRFIFEIDGIPSYLVKAGNRPTITFEPVVLDHINIKRKLKGKGDWSTLEMEWVRTSHESLTGRDGYAEFYKKDVDFYMLGPVGDKIEQWKLKGAFITSANFGDLDWSNATDPTTIVLELTYDYAILEF